VRKRQHQYPEFGHTQRVRLRKSLQKSIENLAIFFQFFTLEKNDSKIFPKSCCQQNLSWKEKKSQWFLFLQTTHTLQCFAFLLGAQCTMHS
jgi:hypothetical protein